MKLVFNVFTGSLDYINENKIPELSADPVSPAPESAWVLKSLIPTAIGSPIGMLLALTHASNPEPAFEFSYRTLEGSTVRAFLS